MSEAVGGTSGTGVNGKSKPRKRALFSCDRCKRRKRACKRYDDHGGRIFDNTTPCEQCKNTGSECETTISRKKRNFFSVSENSLLQLKCLVKIVKAMFPECNPNNFEDIENIARLLYVQLPENHLGDALELGFDPVSKASRDGTPLTDPYTDPGIVLSSEQLANKMEFLNEKPAEDEKPLASGNEINNEMPETEIGLGGAERLFTALLEIEKRRTQKEVPSFDMNNSLTSIATQRKACTFHPSYVINGNDIEKCLILDGIPQDECELYTRHFFEHINENYFLFIESEFRKRQDAFFKLLQDKENYKDTFERYDFTKEEICTIYLVWILGRKSYLLNLQQENISEENKYTSDIDIGDYLNAINLTLSGAFFTNNLATVRLLFLAGLFHASIKNRNSAWHLFANSCLKCVGLGYHRNRRVGNLSAVEQENIRITWWSCFKIHMNNSAILGRLPNISLYEVDLDLPKLEFITDVGFRETYRSGINLFKIMFSILKNREYLLKSRNPWCQKNFFNVIYIKNQLIDWEKNLHPLLKTYAKPKTKRSLVKLHMQYQHCIMSLTVPYLIAYALKPKYSTSDVISTLCFGLKSAVDMVSVISYSSNQTNFNGLLYYDLFYAYNSLMMLLLGFTLMKSGSINKTDNNYNVFSDFLQNEFQINKVVILEAINKIKDINDRYGSTATSVMKDASNNIKLLLNHFKIHDMGMQQLEEDTSMEKQQTPVLKATTQSPPTENDTSNVDTINSPFFVSNRLCDNFAAIYAEGSNIPNEEVEDISYISGLDTDFFDLIDQINNEIKQPAIGINDKFFWDWDKLFSGE